MPDDGEARQRERGRLPALDGLRGLAALVVLVHHTLLASLPTLADAYHSGPLPPRGSVGWLLTETPLHVLWAGPEFVVVFFVLSGFVLSLPAASGGGRPRIASYYPSRFVRLYLPVWGALVFAAALHVAVSHPWLPSASWWLQAHSQPLTLEAARQDAGLLSKETGHWALLDVLWSLRWEVLFSLALPLLLLVAVRVGRWSPAGASPRRSGHAGSALVALLCLAALRWHGPSESLLWHGSSEYLLELPPFVLGMVLAFRLAEIEGLARRLAGLSFGKVAAKLLLGLACVGGLTADWWLPGRGDPALAGPMAVAVALGACLTVVAALVVPSFAAFLRSPAMAWTGRRSYSLYLVHSPIVVALALAAGGRPLPGPYLVAAVSLSLAAAAIFFRCVESPAHRFARRLGSVAPVVYTPLFQRFRGWGSPPDYI